MGLDQMPRTSQPAPTSLGDVPKSWLLPSNSVCLLCLSAIDF